MAYKEKSPIPIVEGGTNATTMATTDGVVYFDGTRLVTTAVGSAADVLTSNGPGLAPTFQSAGASGIVTINGDTGSVTGSTVTIFTDIASNASGASIQFQGLGTNLELSLTDSRGSTYLGTSAGGTTPGGNDNTALGSGALSSLSTTPNTGNNNTAVGQAAGGSLDSGSSNVFVGLGSGLSLVSGNRNIIIGLNAGNLYTGSESDNIAIGANLDGVAAESNTLRIGSATGTLGGNLNAAFICGINGITVSDADQVLVINSSDQIGAIASSSSGNVLTSQGAGANPTWAPVPASSISITGNSGGALVGNAFTFTGGTTGLTFAGSGTTETLGGTLVVANGGTGVATMTTAYAPVVAGTTATGALQVASTGLSTSGFVLTSNGASAVPSFKAVPGSVTWSVITANQTAAVNNGYFCNKAGTLALALPTTSAVGDIIEVANENTATGTQFTQASGQQILIGNTNTTSGATGTLTSSAVGDTLKLVCKTANTVWRVTSGWGNWTVV